MGAELYTLAKSGVQANVATFIRSIPPQCELIWVTYSIAPTDALLKLLAEAGHKVSIVGCHPSWNDDPRFVAPHRAQATPALWKRFERHRRATPALDCQLYGLDPTDYEDGEPGVGPLHAKMIAARSKDAAGRTIYSAAHGSFNLTTGSLTSYCETFFSTQDTPRAKELWDDAVMLRDAAPELTEEDFKEPPRGGEVLGTKRHRGGERPKPTRPAEHYAPEDLRKLTEELDRRLKNWPPGGDPHDLQWRVFATLEDRAWKIDLVYLPVAVGKTYIALRWLCWRIDQDRRAHGGKWRRGLFLTPNPWLAESVRLELHRIADAAAVPRATADALIAVRSPGNMQTADYEVSAVVADESQNFDPRRDGQRPRVRRNYTDIVTRFRSGEQPVLGLSATPYRFNTGVFDREAFVLEWLADLEHSSAFWTYDENSGRTILTLDEARDAGFLTPWRFESLLGAEADERVREILSPNKAQVTAFGEYGPITLRDVWLLLDTEYREQILEGIVKHLAGRRGAIVYVPPVGDYLDEFVAELTQSVEAAGGWCRPFLSRFDASTRKDESVLEEFRARVQANVEARASHRKPAALVVINRVTEGVSIPGIDLLVMLRATLSPRLALQALGRGLRLVEGKEECLILDAVLFRERLKSWEQSEAGLRVEHDDRQRRCRKCKEPGHYHPTCPKKMRRCTVKRCPNWFDPRGGSQLCRMHRLPAATVRA